MEGLGNWLLGCLVIAGPWMLYKVFSQAYKHPDTPYFIRGLLRYAGLHVGKFFEWIALRLPGLTSRPDVSNGLRKALAATVFLLISAALGNWPYNFYVLLRILVTGILVLVIVRLYPLGERFWLGVCGLIALIFNPIAPFHFPKESWVVLNWIAAAFIAILTIVSRASLKEFIEP